MGEADFEGGSAYPAKHDGTDVSSSATTAPSLPLAGWVRDFRLVLDGRGTGTTAGGAVLPLLFGTRVMTIGTLFDAVAARIGGPRMGNPPSDSGCGPTWTDTCASTGVCP